MNEELEKSTRLLKAELGLTSLRDVEELRDIEAKMNTKEAMTRASVVESFYRRYFKRVIKILIQKELEKGIAEGDTIGKVLVNRGSVIGLMLVKEWFETQINLSSSRFDKEE